jgi:hypothetical protein
MPKFERSPKDPFLQQLNASGKKWVIIVDSSRRPSFVFAPIGRCDRSHDCSLEMRGRPKRDKHRRSARVIIQSRPMIAAPGPRCTANRITGSVLKKKNFRLNRGVIECRRNLGFPPFSLWRRPPTGTGHGAITTGAGCRRPDKHVATPRYRRYLPRGNSRDVLQRTQQPEQWGLRIEGRVAVERRSSRSHAVHSTLLGIPAGQRIVQLKHHEESIAAVPRARADRIFR